MMKTDRKKSLTFINIAIILITICAIFWSLGGESIRQTFFSSTSTSWEDGWVQIIDDEEITLDTPSLFEEISKGDTLILENELPELAFNHVLFFYSKDLEIKVYVDDVVIYELTTPEKYSFLDSPGHLWNQVTIPVDFSGKTIRIELTSQFTDRFMGTVTKLYLVDKFDTLSVLVENESFRIVMSVFISLMTIIAYTNALIWKRKAIKRYFMVLGNFYLTITLWIISMCGIFNYILYKPIGNMMICNLMVLLIPIAAYDFYIEIYKNPHRFMRFIDVIIRGNFFLQIALMLLFKISLLDLMNLSFLVYAIGALAALLLIIQHAYYYIRVIRPQSRGSNSDFIILSTSIFFIGALIEIIVLCLLPKRTDLIGFSSISGMVVYMIVNLIALTRFEAVSDVEKIKLEEDYNQLQNVTLTHQIKAHFIYNTLNTISALCKDDPLAADNAIIRFSKYMHSYMHLINERQNIPLMEEIELLQSSLEIERSKYPDTFSYHFDLEYWDFKIPPLSLQPLVENALYHGIRPSNKKGELRITSRRHHNIAQIIISDNGVGFDTSILNNELSIGIHNLKKRLAIMANGSIRIESVIKKGTHVIIEIPLNAKITL